MPWFDDDVIDMRDLLRRLAEQFENAVMDAGADQLCGSGANSRNGYRERSLATCVGTLTLRISKLRSGSFFPEEVIERYQGIDLALVAAVVEMYAIGTSTRKVQRVAGKIGVSRLSKDRVSAIASSLDGRHRGAVRKTARRLSVALRLARRHLRQVPPRGARGLHRCGDESGLELADRVETVWGINRISGSGTPGRLALDRVLHQLSRLYPSLH